MDDLSEAALAALRYAPAGLLTDFDGTLAPIVADPAAARPEAGAPEALARLAGQLAVVGLLTGRAAPDARRLTGVDALLVAGNHGIEWLDPGESEPRHDPALEPMPALIDAAFALVAARLGPLQGIEYEHKGVSAAIHYRASADPAAARRELLEALDGAQLPGVEIREGRMSIELRPAHAGDKGTALRAVARRYGLRGLVVLGDDATDLDAFRAAAELREDGRLAAFIGAVRGGAEVPPSVAAAADAVVGSPQEVVALLEALADGLSRGAADGDPRPPRPDPPADGAATS